MGIDNLDQRILVTGSNGQLGSEIQLLAKMFPKYKFLFVDRNNFSLENELQMINYLNENNPNYIINCAAYTAVDKAETEKELANIVNNIAVGTIAKWSFDNDAKFIHISTDYVFDGTSSKPLTEMDATNPINHYGLTKLLGEENCLKQNPESIIIRTSWVYSEFGNNFVKTMIKLMSEREILNIVNDQVGSPTYAGDLAKAILQIIDFNDWKPGIYNYSNEGEISWFEFAEAIKSNISSNCHLVGVPTTAYPTPAKRPKYSLLNKSKINSTFNIEIPNYKTSLSTCIAKLKN